MANEWAIVAKAFEAARIESGTTEYSNYSWREYKSTKSTGSGMSVISQQSTPVSDAVVNAGITSPTRNYTPYIFRAGQPGVKALIHFEEVFNAEPDTR
jgi:hypothetical protein